LLLNAYHIYIGKRHVKKYSDEEAVVRYYIKKSGRRPDMENPKKFSEKLQWLKLHDQIPLKATCSDKYLVREYVKNCGYENLLNDIYGIYKHVKEIDIEQLPEKFVLKATHGSNMNLIVKDKKKINWFLWKLIMNTWLKQNIYWSGREWVYQNLEPHIIAERYLEDETGELKDYKFFCFNGEPAFLQFESGRYKKGPRIRNFYDMNWKLLPFGKEIPPTYIDVKKPEKLGFMKTAAKTLAKPFLFVRVDFYLVQERPYFSEMTFFPAGGAPDLIPSKYDDIIGEYLKMDT